MILIEGKAEEELANISHFYRPQRSVCQEFCWGEGVSPIACWDTSPGPEAGTPPRDQRRAPPPGADLPGAVHAGRYGQQAGGMHPTGMQSCN